MDEIASLTFAMTGIRLAFSFTKCYDSHTHLLGKLFMPTVIAKPLDFLREVRVELQKVVWPDRAQTIKLTLIVILVTIFVGLFILSIDYLFTLGLQSITRAKGL